ncbi:MAG: histidinol dehydrogenase [Actinomycetota bacterium]
MRRIDLRSDPTADIPRPDPGAEPLDAVRRVLEKVRSEGDAALRELTERFDGARLAGLRVDPAEIANAAATAPSDLLDTLTEAAARIRAVSEHQALEPWRAEIGGGIVGETVHAVERAGIYVPGGRAAYPSSVLMCAVPAKVAGVGSVALCTPPAPDGSVPQATLAAAHIAAVDEVYRIGGAQAIAAMAFGTESIRKVDVIVGPGNLYVALAKREVAGLVQIDSIAGPSEIAVVTGRADPAVLAADLIAQAEHGPHGSFLLITWSDALADEVGEALEKTMAEIAATDDLRDALEEGTVAVLVSGPEQALDAVNRFAPEHVELIFDHAERALGRLTNAGAVFVGPWSPVSLGDYLAGSNHVLPTAGAGRHASGLRTSHFQKATAFVVYDRPGLERALPFVRSFAAAEGLPNHARALEVRLLDGKAP